MRAVYSLTRMEPVSRGGDPGRGLAATVQDAFWMLARQRQFGELTGEDTGSPVQVAFVQTEARFDGWKTGQGAVLPYSPDADVLEALVAGESSGPAISVLDRLQAGRALAAAVPATVADALRTAFPLSVGPDSPALLTRAAEKFADGVAVVVAFRGGTDVNDAALAAALGLSENALIGARKDLEEFSRWCAITFGTGPNSWIPERLERRFELAIGGTSILCAPGHTRERVDWHDLDRSETSTGEIVGGVATARRRIPTAIQLPGAPRNRFWEFEEAALALSRIDATTNDLGRLALVEFSTIYGNDWFTFPIPLAYGSMQTISDLVVRDTFGSHELIAPAADVSWAMYRSAGSSPAKPALAVPSVTVAPLVGEIVEEVRFLRDEMANLVWAVEQVVTDENGRRRDLPDEGLRALTRAEAQRPNADVSYRLMTEVPDYWVPFIPVRLPGTSRQVGLIEAVLPRTDSFGDLVTVSPRSSVLRELRGLVLPEEEVPSAGVVVRRRWFLARSADGGRHAWAARSVTTDVGEGASGLRFDTAEPVRE